MATKTTLGEWVLKWLPAAAFTLGGLFFKMAATQASETQLRNDESHIALMGKIEALDGRVDEHDIQLAVMAARNEMETTGQ